MKKIRLLLLLVTLHFSNVNSAQVKYGTNSTSIASCSLLELESTNKGLLLPRLTLSQRNGIVSPLAGLEIWCIDCGVNGEYQLYIGNSWKIISSVPDAPTITNVSNIDSAVALYFTPPAIEGTSPITSYTITVSPGNRKVTALSSPFTFTDLIIGTAYTFTVTANNIFGSSIASNTSTAITPQIVPSGNAFCNATTSTKVMEITSSATGRIWMDRNLGASRAATAYNDYMAFGCFYQWGRGNDGHASVIWVASNSGSRVTTTTTNVLSTVDTPSDSKFIIAWLNSNYEDWRSPANNLLWQGPSGINNPCPSGFRVPTKAELDSEFDTAVNPITNYINAYSNGGGLKLVAAGYGGTGSSSTLTAGNGGNYWTSSKKGTYSYYRSTSVTASTGIYRERGCAFSVRCIKNY